MMIQDPLKFDSLPRALTSYDVLKALAIILMVVDHIGHFFYPDEMWWRVFGRMCVPIWFFLIGYAKTQGFSLYYLSGGVFLALVVWMMGGSILPLNILITLMVFRLIREEFMGRAFYNYRSFFAVTLIVVLISYSSMYAIEYGTITMLFVMLGFLRRFKDQINIPQTVLGGFTIFSALSFTALQAILLPGLTALELFVMTAGLLVVTGGLVFFKPVTFARLQSAVLWPLQFMGRRSMEIYVLHFIVFYAVHQAVFKGGLTLLGVPIF